MGVRVEDRGAVTLVTLGWPERRNALGPQDASVLAERLERAARRPEACAVVLTGDGAFCAGGNVPDLLDVAAAGADALGEAIYGSFQRAIRAIVDSPIPVLAALDGPAVGFGMDLALACDERWLGPDAWMLQRWAALGLVPGTGGALFLRRTAPSLLWRLVETQDRLDGPRAERWGLGRACDGPALDAALDAAGRLAHRGRAVLEGYCALARADLRAELDEHLRQCVEIQVRLAGSARAAEAVRNSVEVQG